MSFLNQFLDDSPQDDLLSSVKRHLDHVLASKRGFASYVHPIGLEDYSAQSTSRNVAQTVMREILDNIARHEPRVAPLSLTALDQDADHRLNLILRAQIEGRPCLLHIAFSMALGWAAVVDARWAEPGENIHAK